MNNDPLALDETESALADQARRQKSEAKEQEVDWRWQMKTRQGRRIIYRLLASAGVWRSSFDSDALRMAFNEGRRHEGLGVLHLLMQHCPDHYDLMIKEQLANG